MVRLKEPIIAGIVFVGICIFIMLLVYYAPVIEPERKAPVVEPEKKAPVIEPEKELLVIEPERKTPVTESEKKIPVIGPELKAPIIEPERKTPVIEPERKEHVEKFNECGEFSMARFFNLTIFINCLASKNLFLF